MPINMMNRIEQVDVDDNEFHLLVDGERAFICEREHVVIRGEARRGYWLLKMITPIGPVIVERNQYRNDIRERVDIHVNERPVYGQRLRFVCVDVLTYGVNVNDWIEDLTMLYGGEWSAYYDDYNHWAILEKV
jgi:hypothetical protein